MLKVISDVPQTELEIDGVCAVNHPKLKGYQTSPNNNPVLNGFEVDNDTLRCHIDTKDFDPVHGFKIKFADEDCEDPKVTSVTGSVRHVECKIPKDKDGKTRI